MEPAKRFPFLMWGDLVEDGAPVLRRALAGYRAHECMYAWVYLTEYLAHRRLLDLFPGMPPGSRAEVLKRLDGDLWAQFDRSAIDPHFQLSRSMFESVASMACLAAQAGEAAPVFVELGSTFLTAKTRLEIVDAIAAARFADWPRLQPRWLGIDNSSFMHDTTRALHGSGGISLVSDYQAVAKPDRFAVFLSRFVASYAFPRGSDFAAYLTDRFQGAVVEDAYSTTAEDLRVYNHGQHETFFSIPEVFSRFEKSGFETFLLEAYPDFPAGAAPCHVLRYVTAQKGLVTEQFRQRMTGLGFNAPRDPVAAGALLQQLNGSVTPQRWRAVKKAKQESPVWGRTPDEGGANAWQSLVRRAKDFVKSQTLYRRWRRYRLHGPLAVREIHRAAHEEKP